MGPITGGEPIDPAVFDVNWDRYYRSFGKFMHEFACMENELNQEISSFVIYRCLKLSVGSQLVVHSILGGSRLAASRDTLKRILRVINAPKEMRDEISRIFAHLADIHYMRDRLAHNGAQQSYSKAGWFETTNQITVREVDQMDWIRFSPEMLLDMADDLKRMTFMISLALDPEGRKRVTALAKKSKPWARSLRRAAAPWRYKPSRLVKTGPKHERTLPPRGHLPRQPKG